MVQIDRQQLRQVQYIIEQSQVGHHVLFGSDSLRDAFMAQVSEISAEPIDQHLEKLMELPTLLQKRTFLERLSRPVFRRVVHAYFTLVDNAEQKKERVH